MALDVAYVGTKMTHLATAFNANNPILNGTGSGFWFNLGGTVSEYAFIGDGTYNGLQVSLTRRLTKGLQFTSAYTWSHTIDDSDGAFSPVSSFTPIFLDTNGNPLLQFNKGNSPTDIRNNFVFASLYELPFGKGKQFGSGLPTVVDYVIGGWQWNNIVTLQSGTPFDLNYSGSPENRPDVTGPIKVNIDHATSTATISGNFSPPPVNASGVYARPGTLGRNALYGPGFHDWDSGMMKDIPIKERVKVEFRADVFNMFNHPQFQNGSFQQSLNQGVVTGGITTTTNPLVVRLQSNREMQFAVRVTF
jgi:hypothetical protein